MKIGIMQPNFFSYIGYWQLINIVDKYVIYDDVNYKKRAWMNRNSILINGKPNWLILPLRKISQNRLINEIEIDDSGDVRQKLLKKIIYAYKKAPYYYSAYPVVEDIMKNSENQFSHFLIYLIKSISHYLEIKTELIISSSIEKDNTLKGQDKILDVCHRLKANEYYNGIGGQHLYSRDIFDNHGISLHFVKANVVEYKQLSNKFIPNLSIVDIMMFNSVSQIKDFLKQYELIS
ncbi:MAG: WbqC family protein [Prevotellaceae bacterium]|jgi:hypothetical protein|nr:WbqC family protein [Prevotellaceae bacterium]